MITSRFQAWRRAAQLLFFALFVLAPVFDWLRFDMTRGHAYLLGMEWHLGIDDYLAKRIAVREVGGNIFLRLFLPAFAASILLVLVSWRWGRIFCGWACPHFSVVEVLNALMRRASGKFSVWEKKSLPAWHFGRYLPAPQAGFWWPTVLLATFIAFVWAVAILTYAIPPREVYANLWHGTLPIRQTLFIGFVTLILALEFIFARHLFCRYGCSVGLFQSLAWMMNRNALVVGFARERAAECAQCYAASGPGDAACEIVCPMRLRPRTPKARMFSCTQCGLCLDACAEVRDQPLLVWVKGEAARANEARLSLMGWEKQ